jgi:hypothetical protein
LEPSEAIKLLQQRLEAETDRLVAAASPAQAPAPRIEEVSHS